MIARGTVVVLIASAIGSATARAAPDPVVAGAIFREAKHISGRDAGHFWGRQLYGPMLFVDPNDLAAVANEADPTSILKPVGDVYAGQLPKTWAVASTPVEWAGKRWTELYWPLQGLPDAEAKVGHDWLSVTLAHELFHRIQPSLGLTRPEVANIHLDTVEGRYLLLLEWRALAAALSAADVQSRKQAIGDALLFRAERYREFPAAAAAESALEINEGIAEYTGVRLGLPTPEARIRFALYDLSAWATVPSFVRSFAYATGPAYGLLLDQAHESWRDKLNNGRRMDELLAIAAHVVMAPPSDLTSREAVYDHGGQLRAAEIERDRSRKAQLAALKASLVDGPVLRIPLKKSDYAFSPQSLLPLESFGVVYPTLKLSDVWGKLVVTHGGALLDNAMTTAVVSAPDRTGLSGDGWQLTLKDGWTVQPAGRPGDFILKNTNLK